jgi:hypothetical protein
MVIQFVCLGKLLNVNYVNNLTHVNILISHFIILKDHFFVDGKKFNIIQIPTFDGPFLVMETLSRERNLVTGVFILDMQE